MLVLLTNFNHRGVEMNERYQTPWWSIPVKEVYNIGKTYV